MLSQQCEYTESFVTENSKTISDNKPSIQLQLQLSVIVAPNGRNNNHYFSRHITFQISKSFLKQL